MWTALKNQLAKISSQLLLIGVIVGLAFLYLQSCNKTQNLKREMDYKEKIYHNNLFRPKKIQLLLFQ